MKTRLTMKDMVPGRIFRFKDKEDAPTGFEAFRENGAPYPDSVPNNDSLLELVGVDTQNYRCKYEPRLRVTVFSFKCAVSGKRYHAYLRTDEREILFSCLSLFVW